MSAPPPANPYLPPPPGGSPGGVPPSNGLAITALVLGICGLLLGAIPVINVLGGMLALAGLVFGACGIVRGRRIKRGTTMASIGLGLSGVALVVSVVIGFLVFRYLGDLFDFVEPPEPTVEIGEEFRTADDDLTITVTSVRCEGEETSRQCTFLFQARNDSDTPIYLNHILVKAVVDGQWQDPNLQGGHSLGAGESETITGTVSIYGAGNRQFEGLAFDGDDASSHSAVVVDVSSAWDEAG